MSYLSALHGIKGGKAQSNRTKIKVSRQMKMCIAGLNLSKMGTMLTASNTVFFLVDDPKKELVEEIAEVRKRGIIIGKGFISAPNCDKKSIKMPLWLKNQTFVDKFRPFLDLFSQKIRIRTKFGQCRP